VALGALSRLSDDVVRQWYHPPTMRVSLVSNGSFLFLPVHYECSNVIRIALGAVSRLFYQMTSLNSSTVRVSGILSTRLPILHFHQRKEQSPKMRISLVFNGQLDFLAFA
jgi:hypothetical protein